jgi:hypothetical protein
LTRAVPVREPPLSRSSKHAEEVTGNVAQTCCCYRISRQTFCKCLAEYEDQDVEGLRDRSSRPLHSPNTNAEVVAKIMY